MNGVLKKEAKRIRSLLLSSSHPIKTRCIIPFALITSFATLDNYIQHICGTIEKECNCCEEASTNNILHVLIQPVDDIDIFIIRFLELCRSWYVSNIKKLFNKIDDQWQLRDKT